MSAYDLQEQEQLEQLKNWWKENGKLFTLAVTIIAIGAVSFTGWRYYQRKQAEEAVVIFEAIQKAVKTNDSKKARDAAGILIEKYPSTFYTPLAVLISAKLLHASGDVKGAKLQLQWVIDKSGEAELRDIARLRLARILFDEKAYDEALKLLQAKHKETFIVAYNDLKGDILVTQNKLSEAKAAYQLAFNKTEKKDDIYREYLQVKMDALGDVK